MTISIEDFHQDFFHEVMASADVDGLYAEDAFFELFCEYLADAGEFDGADRAYYRHPTSGIRVDGYAGDPALNGGELILIVQDFNQDQNIVGMNSEAMDSAFGRLEKFIDRSWNADWRNKLEETDPAFGLADLIAVRWRKVAKVRLFLITNRELRVKIDRREAGEIRVRTQ